MISPVDSKDIFEEQKEEDLEIKKIDLVNFQHPSSRNLTSNSVGNERSSEVVNYETRQVQSDNRTVANGNTQLHEGFDGQGSDSSVKEEYYQLVDDARLQVQQYAETI